MSFPIRTPQLSTVLRRWFGYFFIYSVSPSGLVAETARFPRATPGSSMEPEAYRAAVRSVDGQLETLVSKPGAEASVVLAGLCRLPLGPWD